MKSIIFFILAFTTYSCATQQDDPDMHDHEQEADAHAHTDEKGSELIELTSEQMQNIGLRFGNLEPRSIRSIVQLKGRVELPPLGMSVASSPIGGQIAEVLVEPGQRVRKGQKLFTVFNLALIDWQSDYLQAQADLEYLTQELTRQKQLSDEKISSIKNYEEILSKKKKSEATIDGLRRKLMALGIDSRDIANGMKDHFSVFANQSGRIEHLNINTGAYVEPSSKLVEIINDDHLHLHILAYGQDWQHLKIGQELHFNIQSRPEDIRTARIKWINNVIDEANNSYDIHAEIIGNGRGLIAGEFVEARIIAQEQQQLTVPTEALTFDRGLKFIFVVDEKSPRTVHFRKIMVRTGIEDLGFVEVIPIDAMKQEEQVVINGAFFLMAESKKGEMAGGGHHH